ncbi:MAG: hypothetical protein CMQ24_16485, partial [Gammaproteobacteria bacterium]|nr:hypothetical protein [Gammaproteobacteria bacterium]
GVRGWVHKVAADPDQRRSGIARHLMAAVEDGLRSAGCPKLNLQVRAGNDAAVAFYKVRHRRPGQHGKTAIGPLPTQKGQTECVPSVRPAWGPERDDPIRGRGIACPSD